MEGRLPSKVVFSKLNTLDLSLVLSRVAERGEATKYFSALVKGIPLLSLYFSAKNNLYNGLGPFVYIAKSHVFATEPYQNTWFLCRFQ